MSSPHNVAMFGDRLLIDSVIGKVGIDDQVVVSGKCGGVVPTCADMVRGDEAVFKQDVTPRLPESLVVNCYYMYL